MFTLGAVVLAGLTWECQSFLDGAGVNDFKTGPVAFRPMALYFVYLFGGLSLWPQLLLFPSKTGLVVYWITLAAIQSYQPEPVAKAASVLVMAVLWVTPPLIVHNCLFRKKR